MVHRKHTYQQNGEFKKLGEHIIAEFFGCEQLNAFNMLEKILVQAAHKAGATVLTIKIHQFEPEGMTGVAVLQESHISIHTWPEYGYVAVDVFTCGAHVQVEKALDVLRQFFNPKKVSFIKLDRGFERTQYQVILYS